LLQLVWSSSFKEASVYGFFRVGYFEQEVFLAFSLIDFRIGQVLGLIMLLSAVWTLGIRFESKFIGRSVNWSLTKGKLSLPRNRMC
jgi:hypothetical protein